MKCNFRQNSRCSPGGGLRLSVLYRTVIGCKFPCEYSSKLPFWNIEPLAAVQQLACHRTAQMLLIYLLAWVNLLTP